MNEFLEIPKEIIFNKNTQENQYDPDLFDFYLPGTKQFTKIFFTFP